MRYTFKEHQITEPEKLWLQEMAQSTLRFDRRLAMVTLLGKLPENFEPERIDRRLCLEGRVTLVGRWHLNNADSIFHTLNEVILAIRNQIIKRTNTIQEISAPELSKLIDIEQPIIFRALKDLQDL